MKRNNTFRIIIIFLFFIIKQSFADHLPGSYITVRNAGTSNIYTIKVVYYRDCQALPASTQTAVNYTINGGPPSSILLPLISSTAIPLLSCTPNGFTTCANGTGVDENIYETNIALLQPAKYIFYDEVCCRIPINTSFNTSASYNEATLDLLSAPGNSLPDFIAPPEFYFCLNNPSTFQCAAIDSDGDSLVYSLIPALDNSSGTLTNIVYNLPYSHLNFIASSAPPTFDTLSGMASFTPNQIMKGLVVCKVEEYRNDTLIGSIMRETRISINNGTVGIIERSNHSIDVYPNPVNNQIHFTTSRKIKSWIIGDITGRTLKSGAAMTTDTKHTISVTDLPSGIYFIHLFEESGFVTEKFIKE